MNSKLATFYHFNSSPKATKGAFPKILVNDLREFPLPEPAANAEAINEVAKLADEIRRLVDDPSGADDLATLEDELDAAVYDLYGIDSAGVATVEKRFAHSPCHWEMADDEPVNEAV